MQAIGKVESEKKTTLLEHFVRRAYASDSVMIALAKKLLPDKTAGTPLIDQSLHHHYTLEMKKAYARKEADLQPSREPA